MNCGFSGFRDVLSPTRKSWSDLGTSFILGFGHGCAVCDSALGRFVVFRMLVHRRAYHSSSWFVN